MSNTTAVPEFSSAGKRKTSKADLTAFRIDGETFQLIRPKTAVIARMSLALDDTIGYDDPKNMRQILGFVSEIVRHIKTEPPDAGGNLCGRARIEQRLNDLEDSLDLENLLPMFTSLMDGWFGRPTGSPPASGASRRRAPAGRGSTARTRSTPART